MKTAELVWENNQWKHHAGERIDSQDAGLILVFGDLDAIGSDTFREPLMAAYPRAHIAGASTAGTIESSGMSEHSLVATVVAFEKGWIKMAVAKGLNNPTLRERAHELVQSLPKEHLRHVFILMDGLGGLDASLLVKGVNSAEKGLCVTGGLAGEGGEYKRTLVFGDCAPEERMAVAIGFYGEALHVSVGCETGWEEFGAERIVTRSEGNVIYEIDHKPAIQLYEDYLGDYISNLPASGLRFPLSVSRYSGDKEVVRVMMGINPDQSIVFAGDIPQGSVVRLMKTNVTNLIDGAELSAQAVRRHNEKPSLAIAITCAGRRAVLKQLADGELEAVQNRLGGQTRLCGFYSYGEIAPFSDDLKDCKLHNQTMTLTVVYED